MTNSTLKTYNQKFAETLAKYKKSISYEEIKKIEKEHSDCLNELLNEDYDAVPYDATMKAVEMFNKYFEKVEASLPAKTVYEFHENFEIETAISCNHIVLDPSYQENARRAYRISKILKSMKIRLKLDKLYENYTNGKYHKKVMEYNKEKGADHFRNPWSLWNEGDDWDYDKFPV